MKFVLILESTPAYPCAGTIINTKYVLTALHCVVKNATKDIEELETFSASKSKVYIGGTLFNTIRNKKNGKKKNEKNKKKNKNNNQNKNKKNIKDMKKRIKNSRKL